MLPWRSSALLVLATVFGGGAIAIWLLWTVADGLSAGSTAQEAAILHLDAVKTGLTVAAFRAAMFAGAFLTDGLTVKGTVDFQQARSSARQEMPAGWRVDTEAGPKGFAVIRTDAADQSARK